jgi:LysM repeat protein
MIPSGASKIQQSLPLSPSPSPQVKYTSPTTTPTPLGPKIHTVSSGESLDSIAKKNYGGSQYWTILWNDNDFIEDPRVIKAGMELKIRREKPTKPEELKKNLAEIYETIINPSPTPAPNNSPETPIDRQVLPAGSFEQTYKDAGSKFGVPWEILYGLHLIETGLRDGPISNGSGPQGPLQFLPGTWASYGIDGNGDGTADINNAIDAIYGAANYLAAHGGVESGLRAYGQVYDKVISAAKSRGWSQ